MVDKSTHDGEPPFAVVSRSVQVPGDDHRLDGMLSTPADATQSRPGVLFVHGMGSSQEGYRPRAEELTARLGAVCLTFDLRGHGGGRAFTAVAPWHPADHLADVAAAYRFLAARPDVDPGRIGVCGASYGAYLSVLLTGMAPVARLVLRAPGMYDDSAFDKRIGTGMWSRVVAPTATVRRRLASFAGPVLLVQSGADEAIPAEVYDAYRQDRPDAAHVVIPGAAHQLADKAWERQFMTATTAFFRDL